MTALDRTNAAGALVLDGHEILIRQLREAGRTTNRKVRSRMRRAGAKAVARAKRHSPSSQISSTIRLGIDRRGVFIRAGGKGAPFAHVFEQPAHGAGGRRQGRHPVFADGPRDTWTWVYQPRRAFIEPAIEESHDDVAQAIADAATDALHGAGIPTT